MEELSQLELVLGGCNFQSSAGILKFPNYCIYLFDHVCRRSLHSNESGLRKRWQAEEEDLNWLLLDFKVLAACKRPHAAWVYLVVFIPNVCPPVSPSVTGGVFYHVIYHRGAGSRKDDDETLPDIGKLSMAEEKKDDMDVDQGGSKKGPSGAGEPKPRDTEAGRADPSKMTNFSGATFEEYRKTAPTYEYSGEGDDRRILPKNTPIDMEKSLPAEAALLIPRAVATQAEAEEAEKAAMEAIRGDIRLPDIGQEDREKVDPHTVTSEDLTASIDALTRKLSDMPEWSGNLLDPAKSAELVGGKASYDKPEAPLTEAGMKSASLEDRANALSQLNEMVNFHKKHLCSGRGAPLVSATAPSGPFAPDQIDASRRFRPSDTASKMTYNLVVLDGRKDYLADRQEINPDLRATGVVPDEAVTCQIVVPSKTRLSEYVPNYEETAATVVVDEAALV